MRTINKRISLALVVLLAATLIACGVLGVSTIAYAASGETLAADSELSFIQMSDIHYFPIDYCYQNVADPNYEDSEFFHSLTGDTKLALESGIILNNAVMRIVEDAEKGVAPHYFIATGDLCKNGEREALIDVANALRLLQNRVRKVDGYQDFQVFANVGNHDLYNTDGALYSKTDGSERVADIVDAAHFAMIFAGLGFPNAGLEGENGSFNLTDYLPADYWQSDYTGGYQYSENSDNVEITYFSAALAAVESETTSQGKLQQYLNIGDGLNKLSYAVSFNDNPNYGLIMFDSTDREVTDSGNPIRMSQSEYQYLKSLGKTTKYYIGEDDGSINMTAVAESSLASAFADGAQVYRGATSSHITGGRLTQDALNWANEWIKQQNALNNYTFGEKTYIAAFHHNILPHFEQEDDILKDFTLYNWEYTANAFLNMGIRYVFTGHQHSSDIAAYTNAEGKTLYDSETGSMVSYESPRRYVTIKRFGCGNGATTELGEQMTSSIFATQDMSKIASSHIDAADEWDQSAYDEAIAQYNANPTEANWAAVLASNPHYTAYILKYDELNSLNYNEYIGKDIYSRLVDRVVAHFLTPDLLDTLSDSLTGMIGGLGDNTIVKMVFSLLGLTGEDGADTDAPELLANTVKYLLDQAFYHLYPDTDGDGVGNYPIDGKSYNGVMDYVLSIVNGLIDMQFGDSTIASPVNPANAGKMTLKEMAGFIMTAHAAGVDFSYDETFETIDATFDETPNVGDEDFRFMNPTDKTYRKRMLAALNDAHAQLVSGKFAGDLFDALLKPLFYNDNSLLKTLFSAKFDLSKTVDEGLLSEYQYSKLNDALSKKLPALFEDEFVMSLISGFVDIPEGFTLNIDPKNFCLGDIVNSLLPIIKPLVANLIGFSLDGPDIITIAENALRGYVTQSFKVGLGGIADNIITAYAFDNFADLADKTDASKPYIVTPHAGYTFANVALTYASSLNTPSAVGNAINPATQDNGRVPSRLTANFDTVNSKGGYTFKFYTAEDVYATFKFRESGAQAFNSVSTHKSEADMALDYIDSVATATFDGVTVEMTTKTVPAYVPLIDLGLLCITHGEITYKDADGNEIPFVYGDRDNSFKNSVIYYNMTTVTITGLKAGAKYEYDIEGLYEENGANLAFSLAAFAATEGYEGDCFKFATAPDEKTDFEFLTIADIQGMIQSMYDDSYKAVNAMLSDGRFDNLSFILNAGDMVDNGKNFNQWAMALDTYMPLFANHSQFFAAGNHEDGKNAFATYFNYTLPTDANGNALQTDITDGAYYSFDYSMARFIVLNTNDASANGLGETQLNWLTETLKNNDAKWTFVLMHKSLFSLGSHSTDAEVVAMRQQLVPLFAEYGVNMVFAGHDHTYTLTNLIDKDGKASAVKDLKNVRYAGDGTMYITLGTLGTKFYEYSENGEVLKNIDKKDSVLHTLDSQTFGKVKVTDSEIVFDAYYYNRETGKIETIGNTITLSENKVFDSRIALALMIGLPLLVVLIVIIIIIVAVKKKRANRPDNYTDYDNSPRNDGTSASDKEARDSDDNGYTPTGGDVACDSDSAPKKERKKVHICAVDDFDD